MNIKHEHGVIRRTLELLLLLIDSPFFYDKKQLAAKLGVDKQTIRNYFTQFENSGLIIESDSRDRYKLSENKQYQQLKDLLHFTDDDQTLLYKAIDEIAPHNKRGQNLKDKLSSLYDFRKLGYSYLRKPYLSKIDILLDAKEQKLQVVLKDYQSQSRIADRLLEVFHVSPADDMLHAFNIEEKVVKHYRISRFKRVETTKNAWEFSNRHYLSRTDPFRIANNNKVMVHLRIRGGAYNELVERFPQTKNHLLETEDPEIFDFQCEVNNEFKGISNFILGYYHQKIEVLEPESLKVHLRNLIKNMNF